MMSLDSSTVTEADNHLVYFWSESLQHPYNFSIHAHHASSEQAAGWLGGVVLSAAIVSKEKELEKGQSRRKEVHTAGIWHGY